MLQNHENFHIFYDVHNSFSSNKIMHPHARKTVRRVVFEGFSGIWVLGYITKNKPQMVV